MDRDAMIRLLVEQLGRHRPRFLTVPKTVQIIRRIIKHARPHETGCILWGGAVTTDLYPRMNVRLHGNHCSLLVHRLVDQLAHDPRDIPWYQEVAHSCDCPPCFHPDHVARERRPDNRRRSAERTNLKKRGALARAAEPMREPA